MEVQIRSTKVEKTAQELVQAEPQARATAPPAGAAEPAPTEITSPWDGLALKVFVVCFLILVGCHLFELVRNLFGGG